MIDLFRAMFATPDAQADAYTWAAVLLAHAMIGFLLAAILTALIGGRVWRAAAAVSGLYVLVWEGGQLLLAGGGIWDGVLDSVAVCIGALAGAATWARRRGILAALGAALIFIISAGVGKRR